MLRYFRICILIGDDRHVVKLPLLGFIWQLATYLGPLLFCVDQHVFKLWETWNTSIWQTLGTSHVLKLQEALLYLWGPPCP